jgi:hypothetical protein
MSVRTKLAVFAAGAGMLGAVATAAPALADTNPSASTDVGVNVLQSITITFNSGASFSLAPNTPAVNATNFTIATNDGHGYHVMLSAPDLQTAGGASIPASDLSYTSWIGGSEIDQGSQQLSNTAAQAFNRTAATNNETISQNWLASLPGNTQPGLYQSTITYTAVGN